MSVPLGQYQRRAARRQRAQDIFHDLPIAGLVPGHRPIGLGDGPALLFRQRLGKGGESGQDRMGKGPFLRLFLGAHPVAD